MKFLNFIFALLLPLAALADADSTKTVYHPSVPAGYNQVTGDVMGQVILQSSDGTTATPINSAHPLPVTSKSYGTTYRIAPVTGFTPVATATDFFGICAGAKPVVVIVFQETWAATTAAVQTIDYIKRSAADTGSTPIAATIIAESTADPAATATVVSFTVSNPTLGAAVGTMDTVAVNTATAASTSPTANGFNQFIGTPQSVNYQEPLTLATGECLYVNYKGAAIPAGLVGTLRAQWREIQ